EVTDQAIELTKAISKVVKLGDKTALNALIAVTESLTVAQFTPSSWAPVAQALADAKTVSLDANASVYDVEDAYSTLEQSLNALILRAAKAGLQSAVDVAATILAASQLYVPSSIIGLPAAHAAANQVLLNDDATQPEVTAAQTALIVAIAAAKLRNNPAPLSAAAAVNLALAPAAAIEQLADAGTPIKAVSLAKPKVVGKAKVGKLVKATVRAPQAKLSYQWYANGKAIAKATKATFKVSKAVKGKQLTVKVTAKRAGYLATVKASAKTKRVN
ncbi:MAG: hypothetical protein LBG70_04260, partial [Bifidobacteriaceae bacterium]|nr:hypothetical protein [Bifidobacteriaceae bacterium]